MRNLYRHKIWKLIGRACIHARSIFEERLKTLTAKGTSIGLDQESRDEITLVMFFPTHLGRPSFKKSAQQSFALFLSTAVLIGTVGSYIVFPLAAVVLTVSVPVNSLWNYANNIVGSVNYSAKLTEMITTGHYLYLDLKPEEQAWIKD